MRKDSHRGHEGHKGNIKVVRTPSGFQFHLSVKNFLTQKPKIRDKPQIPQISQITEPMGFAVAAARIHPEHKVDGRDPVPSYFNL